MTKVDFTQVDPKEVWDAFLRCVGMPNGGAMHIPETGWMYVEAYDATGNPAYVIRVEFRFSGGECAAVVPRFTWTNEPPSSDYVKIVVDADVIYAGDGFDIGETRPKAADFCRHMKAALGF